MDTSVNFMYNITGPSAGTLVLLHRLLSFLCFFFYLGEEGGRGEEVETTLNNIGTDPIADRGTSHTLGFASRIVPLSYSSAPGNASKIDLVPFV